MENGTAKYIETVKYLERLYDYCNEKLFNNELEKPVITVQLDSKNKAYGWFTSAKVWKWQNRIPAGLPVKSKYGEYVSDSPSVIDCEAHEINITAQGLNRPIYELAATMIHEMCHQYASVRNIQDTSRSGSYHNKLYRRIAETHGLTVECVKTSGWSYTELTDESKKFIDNFLAECPEFKVIYRLPFMKGQAVRNTSTRKYLCPVCGNSVRATKEVHVLCVDCNKLMQEE